MRQTGESSLQATVNVNTRTPSLLPFLPKTASGQTVFLGPVLHVSTDVLDPHACPLGPEDVRRIPGPLAL